MGSFDHLRPYLQSASSLQWSYGTVIGRKESHWTQWISQLPPEDMVSELIDKGFQGLWLDTFGYSDPASAAGGFAAVLGRQPLVSSNGRYLFFPLGKVRHEIPPPAESLPKDFGQLKLRPISKCSIDLINDGRPGATVTLNRSLRLRAVGWAGNTETGVALPDVYLELTASNGKHLYLQGVRRERPDVQAAFKKDSLLRSGFAISGNLSTLQPGLYGVQVLQFGANDAQSCGLPVKIDLR
jgi:hypothetical protein